MSRINIIFGWKNGAFQARFHNNTYDRNDVDLTHPLVNEPRLLDNEFHSGHGKYFWVIPNHFLSREFIMRRDPSYEFIKYLSRFRKLALKGTAFFSVLMSIQDIKTGEITEHNVSNIRVDKPWMLPYVLTDLIHKSIDGNVSILTSISANINRI